MRTFLTIFLMLTAFLSLGAVNEQDKAKLTPESQLLKNPGFEASKSDWSASGGTFSIDLASPLFGAASATWDSNGLAQTLDSVLYPITEGMVGKNTCAVEMDYKYPAGSDGDYKLVVRQFDFSGASEADVLELPLQVSVNSIQAIQFFTCPDDVQDTLRFRIESTVADAGLIEIDKAFLGHGRNTIRAVPKNSVETKILTADVVANGDIADFTYTNLVVGTTYELSGKLALLVNGGSVDTTIQVTVNNGAQVVEVNFLRVDDGNTAQDLSYLALSSKFTATDTSLTFSASSASAASFIAGASSRGESYVQLEKRNDLSSPFDEAITLETSGQYWDVNIGGATASLGVIDVTDYTEITDAGLDMIINAGSGPAKIPCSSTNASTGLTCSSGSESVGIVFNALTAGRYKVCAEFSYIGQADQLEDVFATFQWVETPNNAQTILQDGKSRGMAGVGPGTTSGNATDVSSSLNVCGTFIFSNAGEKTLRLMYEQSSTGTPTFSQLLLDRSSITGQRDMHITVEKMDQQFPTPVFTDLQNSLDDKLNGPPSSIIPRMAAAIINNAGTPTLSEDYSGTSTSWIDNVSDDGLGSSTVTFTPGIFDGVTNVSCVCTTDSSNRSCIATQTPVNTLVITSLASTGAAVDVDYKLHCYGIKGSLD